MKFDPDGLLPTTGWRASAWALLVAIFAVGQAIEVGGRSSHLGLIWLGVALASCALLNAGLPAKGRTAPSTRALVIFGAAVFGVQILELFNSDLSDPIGLAFDWSWIQCGVLLAGVLGLAGLFSPPAPRKVLTIALLGLHLALGAWVIRLQPNPAIDVFVIQQEASREFAAGRNPYRYSMPDIYTSEESAKLYPPGWSSDGRLRFGLLYPPMSLLLAFPGYLFAGDHRFAQLVATTLAGAAIAFVRPSRFSALAAALFLFNPRGLYILEQAWTEPLVMMLFAAFLWTAVRAPRGAPWLLGLVLATKQYLVLIVPALPLLVPWCVPKKELPRFALQALGVAAAVTLPFVLWDPGAFYNSVIALHLAQPYRPDSLTYLALLPDSIAEALAKHSPLAALAALGALGLALARGPRTPSGFSTAAAFALLAYFSFNKQAHINYYYLATGILCAALALVAPAEAKAGD